MLKTDLVVRLLAGEVVVAESSDARLWQRTLAAISALESGGDDRKVDLVLDDEPPAREHRGGGSAKNPMGAFASELGVTEEVVDAACGPKTTAPYLHINNRNWEAFEKNFPTRGRGSVGNVAAVATLLTLWFKHAKLGRVALDQATGVLDDLGADDKNPSRSIRNCPWLLMRDGAIIINPAEVSRAVAFGRAFCAAEKMKSQKAE